MEKPTLEQLKNRIESCLADHKLAGWEINKTMHKITLSKIWNGNYESHTMSTREYADRFVL